MLNVIEESGKVYAGKDAAYNKEKISRTQGGDLGHFWAIPESKLVCYCEGFHNSLILDSHIVYRKNFAVFSAL